MKKSITLGIVFLLCGLALLSMLQGVGSVHASNLVRSPIQVQNSGYLSTKGDLTVTATCPVGYKADSGTVQISSYTQGATPTYRVRFNGINIAGDSWVTTVENKTDTSINVTVTVTCV